MLWRIFHPSLIFKIYLPKVVQDLVLKNSTKIFIPKTFKKICSQKLYLTTFWKIFCNWPIMTKNKKKDHHSSWKYYNHWNYSKQKKLHGLRVNLVTNRDENHSFKISTFFIIRSSSKKNWCQITKPSFAEAVWHHQFRTCFSNVCISEKCRFYLVRCWNKLHHYYYYFRRNFFIYLLVQTSPGAFE